MKSPPDLKRKKRGWQALVTRLLSVLLVGGLTLLLTAPCVVVGVPDLGVGLKEKGVHRGCRPYPFLSSLSTPPF